MYIGQSGWVKKVAFSLCLGQRFNMRLAGQPVQRKTEQKSRHIYAFLEELFVALSDWPKRVT